MKKSELNLTDDTLDLWFDEYGMACTQAWDSGLRDSIGRTFLAYMAYDDLDIGKEYWRCIDGIYFNRHPEWEYDDVSRDHYLYYLMLDFVRGGKYELVPLQFGWKLSEAYSQTVDTWLYARALHYDGLKGWWFSLLYWMVMYIFYIPYILLSTFLYKISGLNLHMNQKEYNNHLLVYGFPEKTMWSTFINKALFPVYSLHIMAWQIYLLPLTPFKWLFNKVCLLYTEKYNYLLRLLFGGIVTSEEVKNYRPMTSYRWGTAFDKRNDRDMKIITDKDKLKYNVLDRDLLIEMYNKLR